VDRSIGRLFVPSVGQCGYVKAGGKKLFRLVKDRQTIQFWDGDCRRAVRRGSPFIEVKLQYLCEMLADEVGEIFYEEGDGGC